MNSAPIITRRGIADRLQHFFWLHPEWWSLGLCGFAWVVMLQHGWQSAGHGVHHRMSFLQEVAHWLLMVAAMMLPLHLVAVQVTAFGSLWARRHRAIAGFLLGYFAPWLALGVIAAGLRQIPWMHNYAAPAVAFALAALWQLSPMHASALVRCHRWRPLAPVGWRADRDCLRFGGVIGVACMVSCWPVMIACTLTGHGLIAMTGGMVLGLAERRSVRPRIRTAAAGYFVLAAYYLALALRH